MDPTQNQSGTPGPIFSAGAAPEEPPMTPEPSGTGPKNPFSRGGGDIILQPNDDYYSGGTKPRSKKPIIIGGIIAAVIVITLLVMLPFLKSPNNSISDRSKKDLNLYASTVYSEYNNVIELYDEYIGFNPKGGAITKNPEAILTISYYMYSLILEDAELALSALEYLKTTSSEAHAYEQDINYVAENIQKNFESIKKNISIVAKMGEAFINPIQSEWAPVGCSPTSEAQKLLNSSDKKITNVAQQYNKLACRDDLQISFENDKIIVDEQTRELLNNIATSLSNYFEPVSNEAKDEILNKLKTIIDETKSKDEKQNANQEEGGE